MEKNMDQKRAEQRALFSEDPGQSSDGNLGKISNLFKKKSSASGVENISLIEKKTVLSPLHSEEGNSLLPSFPEQRQKQSLLDLLSDGKEELKSDVVKLAKKQENRNLWSSITNAFRNFLGTPSQQDEAPRGEEISLLNTDTECKK